MAETEKIARLPLEALPSTVNDPEVRYLGNLPEQGELESTLLFQGRRELVIRRAGQNYHLKITRQDRLILTK